MLKKDSDYQQDIDPVCVACRRLWWFYSELALQQSESFCIEAFIWDKGEGFAVFKCPERFMR